MYFFIVPEKIFDVFLRDFERRKGYVTLLVHVLSNIPVPTKNWTINALHSSKLFIQLLKVTTTNRNNNNKGIKQKNKHWKWTLQLQKKPQKNNNSKQIWHPRQECNSTTKVWTVRLKKTNQKTNITEVKLRVSSPGLAMNFSDENGDALHLLVSEDKTWF